LDDVAINKITIEDNVTISYGCYFACHGKNQGHTTIKIKKGAYIGMRCNVLSGKEGIVVGANSIIGAGTLVNKNIEDGAVGVGVLIMLLKNKGEE